MHRSTAHQQLSMLAHALRSVSECVVVTDMQDTILFVNDAFLKTYDYRADQLLGKNIDIVRSSNNPAAIANKILPTTLKEGCWKGEVLNRRRGGAEFPISLSTSVVRNERNAPIALIGVAVDITERKRAERQFVEALEAAEAAAKAKADFLAMMSHEIRTPMNGVIGMTELLTHTELSSKQAEYVQAIQVCGENLLKIINDILDFSKIDSGKLELESRPFEIREAIEEVLELSAPTAAEKQLQLNFYVDPSVPYFLMGDVTRFKQIMTNLVGNGIKFTERGNVDVRADIVPSSAPGLTLQVSVKDTGIGIAADKLHRLFKAFSQVDTSTNRRFGGTGLGLAISTALVQLMGGRIWVDSHEGVGSTFLFTIVTDEAANLTSDAPFSASSDSSLATRIPLRILIAEDNPINQRVIVHILSRLGYSPAVAESGVNALAEIERTSYDLVFMDVHMPEMDGLEATRRIRSMKLDTSQPCIVAITADALTGDREKCLSAGMDDYLTKPIRSEDVQAVIERLTR